MSWHEKNTFKTHFLSSYISPSLQHAAVNGLNARPVPMHLTMAAVWVLSVATSFESAAVAVAVSVLCFSRAVLTDAVKVSEVLKWKKVGEKWGEEKGWKVRMKVQNEHQPPPCARAHTHVLWKSTCVHKKCSIKIHSKCSLKWEDNERLNNEQ